MGKNAEYVKQTDPIANTVHQNSKEGSRLNLSKNGCCIAGVKDVANAAGCSISESSGADMRRETKDSCGFIVRRTRMDEKRRFLYNSDRSRHGISLYGN